MRRATALSIDPGVNAVGWALWDYDKWEHFEAPLCVGVTKPRIGSIDPFEKMTAVLRRMNAAFDLGALKLVVCEWAQFRAGSAVGHSAAVRDDYGHLCHNHGMFHWWALSKNAQFKPAPVSIWKGNLPKQIVEERITRGLGSCLARDGTRITSHAWDAVGIGLWAKGFDLADSKWQKRQQ